MLWELKWKRLLTGVLPARLNSHFAHHLPQNTQTAKEMARWASQKEILLSFLSVFSLNSVDLVKGGSKNQKAGGKQDQQPLSPELEDFSSPGLKVLKNMQAEFESDAAAYFSAMLISSSDTVSCNGITHCYKGWLSLQGESNDYLIIRQQHHSLITVYKSSRRETWILQCG